MLFALASAAAPCSEENNNHHKSLKTIELLAEAGVKCNTTNRCSFTFIHSRSLFFLAFSLYAFFARLAHFITDVKLEKKKCIKKNRSKVMTRHKASQLIPLFRATLVRKKSGDIWRCFISCLHVCVLRCHAYSKDPLSFSPPTFLPFACRTATQSFFYYTQGDGKNFP